MERRSIKGDFNPVDTKVIHFTNNPTAQAIEKRANQFSELASENIALKARVQLLEQGQTTDLTMMVGAKVEESEAEQVKALKEELEKADVKKKFTNRYLFQIMIPRAYSCLKKSLRNVSRWTMCWVASLSWRHSSEGVIR